MKNRPWRGLLLLAALVFAGEMGTDPLRGADVPLSTPLLESFRQMGADVNESHPGSKISDTTDFGVTAEVDSGVKISFSFKDLSDDKVAGEKLGHLGEIPNLFSLNLKASNISDAGLANLKNLVTLKVLNLNRCPKITDAGVAELEKLINLEVLDLDFTQIDDPGLLHLKGFTKLRELTLQKTGVTDKGVKDIVGFPLVCLSLRETKVTDASLQLLKEKVPTLQTLILRDDPAVTDTGLKYLEGVPRLKSLTLRGTGVTDAGMKSLKSLPDLEIADLSLTKVSDAGLADLAGTKIKNLWLVRTPITNDAIKILANLPELSELNISETAVNDSALEDLKKLTKLKTLRCERCGITEAGILDLKKSLPQLGFADAGH